LDSGNIGGKNWGGKGAEGEGLKEFPLGGVTEKEKPKKKKKGFLVNVEEPLFT